MQLGCGCPLMRDPHVGQSGGMWRTISSCATGLIGFAFPRLLIAMGVPLEERGNYSAWRLRISTQTPGSS